MQFVGKETHLYAFLFFKVFLKSFHFSSFNLLCHYHAKSYSEKFTGQTSQNGSFSFFFLGGNLESVSNQNHFFYNEVFQKQCSMRRDLELQHRLTKIFLCHSYPYCPWCHPFRSFCRFFFAVFSTFWVDFARCAHLE